MRRKIIAGNWKMNLGGHEATGLAGELVDRLRVVDNLDVIACPPFPSLYQVGETLRGSSIKLGAQNMHWENQGAFTGEVSPKMLLTVGCEYVILGHSERRSHFGETDQNVNRKILAALASALTPIVCLGETIQERESGQTETVVGRQLKGAVNGLSEEEMSRLVLAYEPVWAIGTGKSATPQMANDVHAFLRAAVSNLYGSEVSAGLRIQYGGSVTEANAASLFSQPDIDGALVGGASLKPDSFCAIVFIGSQHTGG